MGSRIRVVLLPAVLALALTACAQIPTSGPVIAGEPVTQPSPDPFVRLDVPGPQAGADQESIVNGFVQAMTSYKPGYPDAKEFLTPSGSGGWDPASGIMVHTGTTPTTEAVGQNQVEVSFAVAGTVDSAGAYQAAAPTETQEFVLQLEQVDGEWRISNPPDGVIMSEFHFIREFEPHNLYFFDPSFSVLVPDPVYIPRNGPLATLLAQALLRGPSDWLAPAVRTAFPEGTELSVRSVPVEAETAQIELSEQPSTAPVAQRELMAAQLAWTFSGIAGVSTLDATAGGAPLHGEATLDPISSFAPYDPGVLPPDAELYALGPAGVVKLGDDGESEPVVGPLGAMADLAEIAVNTGGNRAVVADESGTELRVSTFGDDETVETVATGTDLSSPAWDRTGLIWAVDRTASGSRLVAVRPDGATVPISAPGLDGRDVERLAVSLDGTRIALIVDGAAHVGLLIRDPDGDVVEVTGLRRIGPVAETLDIAWVDTASVALLLRAPGSEPEPYVVGLSGAVTAQRGTVRGATTLAAAPGQRLIVATSDEDILARDSAGEWMVAGSGTAPAYPG